MTPPSPPDSADSDQPVIPESEKGDSSARGGRLSRVRTQWHRRLDPGGEQSLLLAWSSFTATFAAVRALTHWIHDGHGPAGGGIAIGGKHFHHYNIGIGLLAGVGATAVRGKERHRRHPATALVYGSALALVVDELALLLDLKDVYWARDGRKKR